MCPTIGKDQGWNVWDSKSALFAYKDRKHLPLAKVKGDGRQNPSTPLSYAKLGFVAGDREIWMGGWEDGRGR